MNTRDRVIFAGQTGKRTYDPIKGEYVDPTTTKTLVACDVSDVGIEESIKVFGNYKDDRKIIHLLRPYKKPFSYLLYKSEKYKVLSSRLSKSAFYIEKDTGTV